MKLHAPKSEKPTILVYKRMRRSHFTGEGHDVECVRIIAPHRYRGKRALITWGENIPDDAVEHMLPGFYATSDMPGKPTGYDPRRNVSVRWCERVLALDSSLK